jgi:hypothetical protein
MWAASCRQVCLTSKADKSLWLHALQATLGLVDAGYGTWRVPLAHMHPGPEDMATVPSLPAPPAPAPHNKNDTAAGGRAGQGTFKGAAAGMQAEVRPDSSEVVGHAHGRSCNDGLGYVDF